MKLTLQNILHIPGLYSNLISISKICSYSLDIIYKLNVVTIYFPNNNTTIKSTRKNSLYLINILEISQVFLTKVLYKPALIDVLYCYFVCINIKIIQSMLRKKLVDKLEVIRSQSIKNI